MRHFETKKSDGKTVRFELENGRAVDRTVRPAPTEYNCGKVKSLKMHNDHVLIAWEKCLIEEISKYPSLGSSPRKYKIMNNFRLEL